MKYQVVLYSDKGEQRLKQFTDAKSHLGALKKILSDTKKHWTHASVTGKITRRYNNSLKTLKGELRYFKTVNGDYPAILVLIGNIPEFHRYPSDKQRDEAFQLCIESQSAASAKADPEPTATIASSTETKDSKTGSTAKKTSNGSVTPATWLDSEIPENTAESSGKSKAAASVKHEWTTGFAPAPSKSRSSTSLIAKVKIITPGTSNGKVNFVPMMKRHIGKVLRFTEYHGNWKTKDGWVFAPEWLEPVTNTKPDTKLFEVKTGLRVGENLGGIYILPQMANMGGQILTFKPTAFGNWNAPNGFIFPIEALRPVCRKPKTNYAKLPETNMSSEEIQANLDKFKFVYGMWHDKKGLGGVVDPSSVS